MKEIRKEKDLIQEKDFSHEDPRILMSMGFGFIEVSKRKVDAVLVSEGWYKTIKTWKDSYQNSRMFVNINGKKTRINGKIWEVPILKMKEFNDKMATVISEGKDTEKLILLNLVLKEKKDDSNK